MLSFYSGELKINDLYVMHTWEGAGDSLKWKLSLQYTNRLQYVS